MAAPYGATRCAYCAQASYLGLLSHRSLVTTGLSTGALQERSTCSRTSARSFCNLITIDSVVTFESGDGIAAGTLVVLEIEQFSVAGFFEQLGEASKAVV